MKTFKQAAVLILKEAGVPLHIKDITKRALKAGYLTSEGKTPEATMNALLIVDVNKNKEKSIFEKVGPATFRLRNFTRPEEVLKQLEQQEKEEDKKRAHQISKNVSTKQKGDIAESRIAELLVLYGSETLSCYKPISDDDGIDIIVKKKKSLGSMNLQVKSRFGKGLPVFTATVKQSTLVNHKHMAIVFCFFDTEKGDLGDYLWIVPADEFIAKAIKLKGGLFAFVAGLKKKEGNRWDQYMIERKELAEKVISMI